LEEHTAEVLQFGVKQIGVDPVFVVAAIWHDFAKIFEYEFITADETSADLVVVSKPYRDLIGHIVGSYTEFVQVAQSFGYPDSFIASVGHCILAHHGRKEWGSPVEPRTPEAWMLHSCDMMSAQRK